MSSKKKIKRYNQSDEQEVTLLQDEQLERGLLASLLVNANSYSIIRALRMFLTDDDFTDEENRFTWLLMNGCVDNSQEVNMINVYSRASSIGKKWNMTRYVLLNGSEGDVNMMAIALSTMGIKRRITDGIRTILMDIEYNTSLSPEQAISDIEKLVEETTQTVKPKTIVWQKIYSQILTDYEKIANGEKILGNKCGFSIIDKKGGFEHGELMVIGARTSNGKTAFTLNCAVNIAMSGVPVGIFSLEMTNKQLGIRILSILSGMNSMGIKNGTLSQEELDKITSVKDTLPIHFDDVRSPDIDVIINNIKGMVLQHGVEVVVLDYLQLMRSRERERVQQIGNIAHRLEALSKQLEITIVLISQLRRNIDKDPCPRLEELKESGDIADAADSVYLIYRPEQHGSHFRYPDTTKTWSSVDTKGTAMLMCVKNRQGNKFGEDILGFDASTTRFYQLNYYKYYQQENISEKDNTPF